MALLRLVHCQDAPLREYERAKCSHGVNASGLYLLVHCQHPPIEKS